MFRDEGKAGKHNICGVNNYRDGTFGHNGDNGLSESSLKYNPTTGESFYYAAVGETLTFAVAYEVTSKQKEPGTKITKEEVFLKQEELLKAGFGFEAMKSMVDQGVSFGEIAENLNTTLEEKEVQSDSFVERLGLQKSGKEERSFVERMRSDKTQDKSNGASSGIITSGDEGAIDVVRMNDSQNLQQTSSPTPIIFLLGTSTAGKSTICEEIERQDGLSEKLGFETWGVDLEFDNEVARCREFLQHDERFLAIEKKFPHPWKIMAGIYLGEVKDSETGKLLNLNDDVKFTENLDDFLAQTEGRYDKEALEILKTLAKENPNNFRERADLTNEGMSSRAFERAVDHAIENSKNGKPTILDMVPNSGGGDLVTAFEKRLVERNFTCPTRVALVHLSVADLTERMDQRNQKALAAGGNPNDQRNGIFPFQQYAAIFGASAEEGSHGLGTLHSDDVHQAVEKFGNKDGVVRDREGKELLDRLGFAEGKTSITVGAKVKADVVFEHSSASATTQIAEDIREWAREKMLEGKVRDPEKEADERFAKNFSGDKKAKELEDVGSDSKKSWVDRLSNPNQSRDDSAIKR